MGTRSLVKGLPTLVSICAAAIAAFTAYRLWDLNEELRAKLSCVPGRSLTGCAKVVPRADITLIAGEYEAQVYKSPNVLGGSSDIAVISKDGLIVWILDLDLEGDRRKFGDLGFDFE